MSDKTLQVFRSRLPTGRKASFQDYINALTEALKVRPLTPSEMGLVIGKTREWTQKKFVTYMMKEGIVKQVEATHAYQLSNQNMNVKQLHETLASESEFYQCETIKRWQALKGSSTKTASTKISTFKSICLGRIEGFKANPDLWVHNYEMAIQGKNDTTKECVEALKRHYGKDKLNSHLRSSIRAFIMYGLGKQLPEEHGEFYSIDGSIDKPKISDLALTKEQYELSKKLALKHGKKFAEKFTKHVHTQRWQSYASFKPEELFLIRFGVGYWSGVRPSTIFTIECDSLEFYDRHVKYIEVNGKIITDSKIIEALKDKFEVKEEITRACHFKVKEHKTGSDYDKYIYDEEIVKMLEKLVQARRKDNFKYVFFDSNEDFDAQSYDQIVEQPRKRDNLVCREILKELGQPSLALNKAWYSLRHYSIQNWLSHTDYDYGFVVEMFHESIDILRKWYGKFTRAKFEAKVNEVRF